MTCAICGQSHAADAPCETLVKERFSTGTRVLASSPSGSAPLIASPAPMPSAFTPGPARTPGPPLPPAAAVDPVLGTTIGSFRIVKFLGKGGMGTVYLGEQTVIGSKVAIKFLHEHLASSASLVSRFYAEARAVNLIGHENIVNIFDMNVVPPSRYYLIMEYLDGRPLNGLVKGPVPPEVTIPILMQVCDALDAAHQNGVVHRDLKPENIFVIKRGRNEHFVKVLDFGIAKLFATEGGGEQTSVGTIVGTPEYMAPEQANGELVDGRSDLYALGIIAYLMACGRLPFYGGGLTGLLMAHREKIPEAPHLVNPALPRAFSDLITKAIAKKPSDRFQSAAAFGSALEALLETLPKKGTSPSGTFPVAGSATAAPMPVRTPAAVAPAASKGPVTEEDGAFAWAGAVSIPTPARAPTPAPKPAAVPWPAASTPKPSSSTPSAGSPASAPAPFAWPTAAGAYPASPSTPSPRAPGGVSPAPPGQAPTPLPVAPAAAAGAAPTPQPVLSTLGAGAPRLTPRPLAPTPAPTHPRHAASFDATVVTAEGTSIGTLKCQDISKGGAFLCTQGKLPAVFSRVRLKLPVAGDFEAVAEVVRHVTPEQAAAWGMLPGFGVQFIGLTPEQRDALGRVVQGLPAQQASPPPRSDRDDPAANATISAYTKRINGDHYVVLGLLPDAEFSELRARGRDARKELEALKLRPISAQQRAQIDTALQKIQAAMDCIGTASARLEYDANRANFRGVARCIAAGLTVTEIEAARKKFLATHSGAETNAHVKFVTGKAWEGKAAYSQAVDLYEQALQLDPLNLALQQRYWALKRRPQP